MTAVLPRTAKKVIDVRVEKKDDHEVIRPRNLLRAKAVVAGAANAPAVQAGEDALIEKAERALQSLAKDFDTWMDTEVEGLVAAHERDAAQPDGPFAVAQVAHDIKGQAATLGFPIAALVAASLCHLLDEVPHAAVPTVLVDQHVEAIRAIVRERVRDDRNSTALALAKRLSVVSVEFVEGYHRAVAGRAH
jgi:HPt (histidine-containing phosphotransfer) domain-containing protein